MDADHLTALGRVLIGAINVSESETFTLTVYSVKGVPSLWSAKADLSGIITQNGPPEFTPSYTPSGAGSGPIPGWEKWTFKAQQKGSTPLIMTYDAVFAPPPQTPPTLVTLKITVIVK
jgi:hypothetical protein